MSLIYKILLFPLKALGMTATYLFQGYVLKNTSGASFDSPSGYDDYLHRSNNGLLLDGESLRLSQLDSFQNVCVMARVGAGKTSRYIIPNVLDKARKKCSLVVNDPKGEVFEATSGHLKKCGYNIIVIDPENLERSNFFNPLSEAQNNIELEQIAEILVRCGTPSNGGKDDFWVQGAIRFVSLFIKSLKNAEGDNPAWFNLYNLYYLFQNFGQDGQGLKQFMDKYLIFSDDPLNKTLQNEWDGLLSGNEEGYQSFVLNAITSLKSLSNHNIAALTSKSDIRLEEIRHTRTAVFMITPAQHAEYYGFLTSLFFRSVFNACMREMPNRNTLPVYILYDEFGHSSIPNFVSTANTIRGYKVSLSIILQSISQLNARYGKDYAESIQGGFNTYLTYSGADPETSSFFERIIGKVRERQRNRVEYPQDQYREYNLMNANEVRTIAKNEALVVSGNKQPIKLKTIPYFKNWKFSRASKQESYISNRHNAPIELQTVELG